MLSAEVNAEFGTSKLNFEFVKSQFTSAFSTQHSELLAERLREVIDEIRWVFDAGRDPDEAVGEANRGAAFRRHRRVGHRCGMADERFDSTQALCQRHQPDPVADPARVVLAARIERQHSSKPAHLALRELVLGMVGQPWVKHTLDGRVSGEELRESLPVDVVLCHAQRQRLGAAQHEE